MNLVMEDNHQNMVYHFHLEQLIQGDVGVVPILDHNHQPSRHRQPIQKDQDLIRKIGTKGQSATKQAKETDQKQFEHNKSTHTSDVF